MIDYPGEVSTPTSELTTMKLHINSAISDVRSRYMCMDVNDLYLNNQMDRYEYIMIQISMIPQEFVENIISQKSTQWIHLCKGNKGNLRTPPNRTDST